MYHMVSYFNWFLLSIY